jgi:hypothetical protein
MNKASRIPIIDAPRAFNILNAYYVPDNNPNNNNLGQFAVDLVVAGKLPFQGCLICIKSARNLSFVELNTIRGFPNDARCEFPLHVDNVNDTGPLSAWIESKVLSSDLSHRQRISNVVEFQIVNQFPAYSEPN